jgi:hypothetical protein
MQEVEDEQARQQAREAQRMPQNAGIKPMPPAVNNIPPPMGMTQPAPNPGQTQPAQPQQPAQPANGQLASVGGGASPNANPINSFGGLSSAGDINGNAALGTQNMAGGEKMSAGNEALAYLMSIGNIDIPDPDDDLDYDERAKSAGEKWSALGLWDRIRAKRERGGKPAKPGDKDYPDSKSWKKVTSISKEVANKPKTAAYAVGKKQASSTLESLLNNKLLLGSLKGGLMGGAAGAISAEKGKILRGALRGATFGVPVGLLSAAGGKALKGFSDTELAYGGKPVGALPGYQQVLHRAAEPTGAILGALAGMPLGAHMLAKTDKEFEKADQREKDTKKEKQAGSPAWQRSAGKNDEGGLNAKGRASYNKATGGNLKAPVTESNPKGKRAKRQNSFCSRMCGMKKHETGAKTKSDPDSRINKSLRKWNCKCSRAMQFGVKCARAETTPSGLPKFKYPAIQKILDQILPKLKAPPTGAVKYIGPVAQ